MNSSRLSAFCDRALEAGWLLGVTITPVFFNVYSSRVFEPDKLTTLRALSLVMAILWLVRFLEEWMHGKKPMRFSWQTPMVLPALLTMGIYLISSIFSLVPYTSFIGSYQRLQGTYTLFGYLVIFFAILTSLRTREQLSRLMTVLILNSLPVSLYGIIQHNGLDPLPWAGDVQRRVASNMGNAIFVAAYLVMIVPLTGARIIQSFNDILSREESRLTDIFRTSAYIFLLAVQLLTIWYARSRGPWLGIVAGGFLFPYLGFLILQRQANPEKDVIAEVTPFKDILKGLGLGVGALALSGSLLGLSVLAIEGNAGLYIGGLLAALSFGGIWLYFIVERIGWRWLWISWGTVGLAAVLLILSINLVGPLHDAAVEIKSINRLARITELESGTGQVRALIWQGALDLVSPHEPIEFHDGSEDKYNAIRPLIGYGPESMYVAYNSFYPPLLGHFESRTASPDRSHNETLDAIVITGVLGLGVYLFTFIGFFYWGLHWLGLLENRRQFWMLLGLDTFFSVLFFFIGLQMDGAYLFVVAIPLGILAGTMVYLTLVALFWLFQEHDPDKDTSYRPHPHSILLIAIIAAVMAHYIEINFGIAIAATRTTFWAFAGILVVLGYEWVPSLPVAGRIFTQSADEEQELDKKGKRPKKSRSSHRRRGKQPLRSTQRLISPWLSGVLALSLTAVFLLGTLAFDFVNNPERLSDSSEIFVRSLTMKYHPEKTTSYGALVIFVFTWALFGLVGIGEYDREGVFEQNRTRRLLIAAMTYAGLSLIGLLIFGSMISGYQASLTQIQVTTVEEVVGVAETLASMLGQYYGLIFFLLGAIGLILLGEQRLPRDWGELWTPLVLVILLLGGISVIRKTNYDLIRADIVYKQGGSFANQGGVNEKQIGILHYERSIDYVPREDYYYLFLGKTYLELAQGLGDEVTLAQRQETFRQTEAILQEAREINPLNTDHSANLARFYKSWAARLAADMRNEELSEAERAELAQQQDELLEKSLENYNIALTLSPNNAILWNEKAQLYAMDLNDMEKFQETISKSLEIDPEFGTTWMLLGDMSSSMGQTDKAVQAYENALEFSSRNERCTIRRVLGTLYAQGEDWGDATRTLEEAIEECGNDRYAWEMYRVLAISYANQGQGAEALEAAQQALTLAPENQQDQIQQLIETLQTPVGPEAPEAPLEESDTDS
ncbi:MAG: hypothetical protein ACLFTI_04205 [Anaerolineales bacterium]